MKAGVVGVIAIGLVLGGYVLLSSGGQETPEILESEGEALVTINLPASLGSKAKIGQRFFDVKCVACHGENGAGVDGAGPPLIHKIYEPSHHADESFQRAVQLGVRSHHWGFGDMPPVEGLTRADVTMIVAYIRELQQENGIY